MSHLVWDRLARFCCFGTDLPHNLIGMLGCSLLCRNLIGEMMANWKRGVGAVAGMACAIAALAGETEPRVIYVADTGSITTRGGEDGTSWLSAYDSLQDAIDDARAAGGRHQILVAQGHYIPEYSPFIPSDDDPDAIGSGGAIPDRAKGSEDPGEVVFMLDVVEATTIDGLELGLELVHTWTGDLQVTLVSPAGTEIEIMNRVGAISPTSFGDSSDLDGTYLFVDGGDDIWDAADAAGALLPEGSYAATGNNFDGTYPTNALSVFDGESSAGTWTLTIRDWTTGDVGVLDGWLMNFATNVRGGAPQGPQRERRFEMYPEIELVGGHRGPFSGGEFDPDDRNPDVFRSFLNGELETDDDDGGGGDPVRGVEPLHVYHVVNASAADATSLLDGFYIINGDASGADEQAYGGGVYVGGEGHLVMRNCVLETNSGRGGAGLYIGQDASAVVSLSTFRGNTATEIGGGVYSAGQSWFSNIEVYGNSSFDAAGVYNDGDAIWANAMVRNNAADFMGGGIMSTRGIIEIINCTVAGNDAGTAGGIAIVGGAALRLNNSILWGNRDFFGGGFVAQLFLGTMLEANNSIVEDVPTDEAGDMYDGLSGLNPEFVNPDTNDYRLELFSPGVDGGLNTVVAMDFADLDQDGDVTETVPYDVAGRDRIDMYSPPRGEDGGGDGEAVVDIGAYEFDPAVLEEENDCPGDTNGDRVVDFMDLEILLEQWNTPGPEADFDNNGNVDFLDLNELLDNWGVFCDDFPKK